MVCKMRKSKRVIGRTATRFEKILCQERINVIYRAAEMAAGGEKSKEAAYRERIDRLLERASHLSLLLCHSRGFLRGDSRAGDRLLSLLNYLVQRTEAMHAGSRSVAKQTQADVSGSRDTEGESPGPSGGGFRGRHHNWPCFVSPVAISDIVFGVLRVEEEISGGFGPYLAVVSTLVEEISALEILFAEATTVHDASGPVTYESFDTALAFLEDTTVRLPLKGAGYFYFKYGNPGPLPLDLCRLEKWQATRDAEECFKQLGNEPRYEIEDIIDIDRSTDEETISRRACAGDLIEISGSGYGGAPLVVFPGGYAPAEYTVRTSSLIRCRVPEGTRSGNITIEIPVRIPECSRLGMSRLPASDTDRYLEISEPVILSEFRVRGSVEVIGEDHVRVEACQSFSLYIAGDNADRAVLTDGSGFVVWEQEGPGISGGVGLNTSANEIYIFEISGFCGRIFRELIVETYRAVHLSVSETQVRVGHTVDLYVSISCPAPAGGLSINLINTTGVHDVIEVPGLVIIPEGEMGVTVTVTAGEHTYEAGIRGDADDHESGSIRLLVYDVPVIYHPDSLRQVMECGPFTLDLEGSSFDIEYDANTVRVTDGYAWRTLDVTGISFERPENRVHNQLLHLEGNNLSCGLWQIYVTSHSLESEPAILDVLSDSGACRAEIVRFAASPDSITIRPEGTLVTLEWEVFKARHITITSDIRGEVLSREYSAHCVRHETDSFQITLNETHTFTLEACAREGAPITTESLRVRARISADGPEIMGFRQVFVQNCHVDGYSARLVVDDLDDGISEDLGELSAEYDDWGICTGEMEVIELTDSHNYRITAWYDDDPIAPGMPCELIIKGDSDGPDSRWILPSGEFYY